MKYMLLIHQGDTPTPYTDGWEELPEETKQGVYAAYPELNQTAGVTPGQQLAQAAQSTWFVPTAKNWANVESANVLRNMLTQILTGKKSVQAAAQSASSQITSILNSST